MLASCGGVITLLDNTHFEGVIRVLVRWDQEQLSLDVREDEVTRVVLRRDKGRGGQLRREIMGMLHGILSVKFPKWFHTHMNDVC